MFGYACLCVCQGKASTQFVFGIQILTQNHLQMITKERVKGVDTLCAVAYSILQEGEGFRSDLNSHLF